MPACHELNFVLEQKVLNPFAWEMFLWSGCMQMKFSNPQLDAFKLSELHSNCQDVDVRRGQGWESDKSITQIKYSQLSPWLAVVYPAKGSSPFRTEFGHFAQFRVIKNANGLLARQTRLWPVHPCHLSLFPALPTSGRVLVHSHRTTAGRRTQLFVCVCVRKVWATLLFFKNIDTQSLCNHQTNYFINFTKQQKFKIF